MRLFTFASVVLAVVLSAAPVSAQTSTLNEGFTDLATLTSTGGWVRQNNSDLAVNNWFQGNDVDVFPAQAGPTNSYAGANFQFTSGLAGTETINGWLVTPHLILSGQPQLTFFTRSPTGSTFPDRLEIRMSTNGNSTNVGTLSNEVGDFTSLLLSINPTLAVGGYPGVWTQYTVDVPNLSGGTTGRLAFRYHVTNAGLAGANSDYIGIDTVTFAPVPEPTSLLAGCALAGLGVTALRRRFRRAPA